MKKKFKDTKIGGWLKDNIPNAVDLLADSKIPIVSQIASVVEKVGGLDPEKKEEFHAELQEYEQNDLPLLLADTADARNREIQIVTSEKAPLINKIITPVLAIVVIGLTFTMFYMVLFKKLGVEKDIIIYILGVLSASTTQILSYFFGSSAGSKDKSDQIKKLMEQQ